MRLYLLAVLLFPALSAPVAAQFDDSEFDDEFAAEPEPEPEPEPAADGFDDDEFDDDEFDEGEFDVAPPDSDENSDADADADADRDGDEDESDADDAGEPNEDEDEDEDEEEADYADPRDDPADARRFRMFNSYFGPTGGIHVMDAHPAAPGTFRAQLGFEFFAKDGFLLPNDQHSRVGGALSISWAIHNLVEVYSSLVSYANSNSQEFPDLLIVLSDINLGTKIGGFVSPVLAVGGDIRFQLPTGNGLGVAFDGLGLGLRANLTADLRGAENAKPLIVRANVGYTFDRSERLIDGTEDQRFELLEDPLPRQDETRHLVSRVERYALGINRTDFFHLGVGLETPIAIRDDIHLSPLLEWNLDVPVNRQGYDCPFVPAEPGGSSPAPGDDDCLDRTGFESFPMSLTLGLRLLPVLKGFGTWIAMDIGLTGRNRSSAVRELAQNEPWRLMLGFSYAHDTRGPRIPEPVTREVEVPVEIQEDPPPRGRVIGRVIEKGEGTPIPNAIIGFLNHDATSLMASDQGRFTTYAFDPGPVEMSISAEGMNSAPCEATIGEEGEDVEVTCELERQLVAVEEEQVVILEQIQFAFDSDEILSESFGLMGQIAQALRDNPQIRAVEIQGHTDDQGAYEYNESLSQRRAESVQRWLVENGIDAGRLRARGYGESRPLVNDTTDEARARNRRVEFRITERSE
ncbi:MAG: OmpA family protein [Myxococcota bacterium]